MAGVNIYDKDNYNGTISNPDGSFLINLATGNHKLVFSFMGYKPEKREIYVDSDRVVNISLCMTVKELDEVKVVSNKKKKFFDIDIGRALESISLKDIEKTNTSNASDILHSRISGVWATEISGLPGDHESIHIRGISSLFGCVDPLFVVDGTPVPSINYNSLGIADLNINDIENITVLKDASSTALFGYLGGNGVVLIDTKRGNKENNLEFSTKSGYQWFSKRYDLMGTRDFLSSILKSSQYNLKDLKSFYPAYNSSLSSYNWQDHIFQNGSANEYQLTSSGSIKNTGYYISGNINDNQGIIKNTSYKRHTFSANINHTLYNCVNIFAGYMGSTQENNNNLDNYGGNAVLFEGINKSPCILSTPDSFYVYAVPKPGKNIPKDRIYYYYPSLQSRQLTDSLVNDFQKKMNESSNTFRGAIKINFSKNLDFSASSDWTKRNFQYNSDIHRDSILNYNDDYFIQSLHEYLKSNESVLVQNNLWQLNFQQKVNKHEFNINSGIRYYNDNASWHVVSTNVDMNNIGLYDEVYIRNSFAINGNNGLLTRHVRSYLGNFNYNFDKKYFISLAVNYEKLSEDDCSSLKAWFPSVAVNWDLARENPLIQVYWLTHLNLSPNWGRSGNNPLNVQSSDLYGIAEYNVSDSIDKGKYTAQLSNHLINKETLEEFDFGTKTNYFKTG